MSATGSACIRMWTAMLLAIAGGGNWMPHVALPENPHALEPNRACGVYCVKFLASYLGAEKSYAEIAALCAPGPQGTTLEDLRRTFEHLGLHAVGVRASVTELNEIGQPAVLSVRNADGTGHFVVWLGDDTEHNAARLFSPPQWVGMEPLERLGARYTGLALVVWDSALPEHFSASDGVRPIVLWLWAGALVISGWSFVAMARRPRKGSRGAPRALLLFAVLVSGLGCARNVDQPASAAVEKGVVQRKREDLAVDAARAVDLGRVNDGVELTHTFRVRNTSGQPLRIMDIEKSCTCQTGTVRVGTVVAPGEVLDIPFTVSTRGTRGRLVRSLRLHTDSSEDTLREVYLELVAEIDAKLRAVPSQIMFGTVRPGEAPTRELRVESSITGLLETFQEARCSLPAVSVALCEKRPGALVFDVAVAEDAPLGPIYGAVTLRFSNPECPVLYVPLAGTKVGALQVLPREIMVDRWLGDLPRTRVLRVSSTTGQAFRIMGVDCPDWIRVDEILDKADVAFELGLSIGRPQVVGEDANIVIQTDHLEDVTCPIRIAREPGS